MTWLDAGRHAKVPAPMLAPAFARMRAWMLGQRLGQPVGHGAAGFVPRAVVALAAVLSMAAIPGCSGQTRVAALTQQLAASVAAGDAKAASRTEARLLAAADAEGAAGDAAWVRTRNQAARIAGWAGHDAHAMSIATATLDAVQAVAGPDSDRLVAPLETIGWLHVDARRWHEAREVVARIVSICTSMRRSASPASPIHGCSRLAGLDLALLATAAGDPRTGAAEYLRRFDDDAPVTVADGRATQATMVARWHLQFGDNEAAARHLRGCGDRNGALRQREGDVDGCGDVVLSLADAAHEFDSQAPRCLDDAIVLAGRVGRGEEAARLAAIRRAAWQAGPDEEDSLRRDLDVADARNDDPCGAAERAHALAFYLAGKGRPAEAIVEYAAALARLARGDHRDGRPMHRAAAVLRVDLLLDLAAAHEEARAFVDAEAFYRRAADSASRFLHPAHAWILDSAAGIARSVAAQRRTNEAERLWQDFVVQCGEARGPGHVDCARALDALASIHLAAGREAEAARTAREANAARSAAARRLEGLTSWPAEPAASGGGAKAEPPPSGSPAPGPALPPPPSPAIQRPPRNASRWNAAERSSYPWPRSPFVETPSTSPARCRRSATPPRTST